MYLMVYLTSLVMNISNSTYPRGTFYLFPLIYPSNSFLHFSKWHSSLLATPEVLESFCTPAFFFTSHTNPFDDPLGSTLKYIHSIRRLTTFIATSCLSWYHLLLRLCQLFCFSSCLFLTTPGVFLTPQLPEWSFQKISQKMTFFLLILWWLLISLKVNAKDLEMASKP